MADEPTDARQRTSAWTRPDEYVVSLARRRTARRSREARMRTEPDDPRFVLSTLPFMVLIGALALIAAALFFLAWPGNRAPPKVPQAAEADEPGVARRGWLDEAKREFHSER